jgi:hypothetical protein
MVDDEYLGVVEVSFRGECQVKLEKNLDRFILNFLACISLFDNGRTIFLTFSKPRIF